VKYLPLIWSGLWRRPARAAFTMASLAVGFLLFGLLEGVDTAFGAAVQRQRLDRLLTDPRFGEPPLPLTYAERIESVPGVTKVVWTQFLFGSYRQPTNGVLVIATEPARFFNVRNEYLTSPEHLQALQGTRTGLIVLESLAARLGWKVGDKITLQTPMPQRDGNTNWTFDIVGTLTIPTNPGQVGFALANYEYLDEARASGRGTVRRFVLRIDDPRRSVEVSRSIDALFENSPAPTRTLTENEIAQAQLASVGDVRLIARAIIAAVFFAIAFLAGNTILQSVRERTSELGTLKALGYADRTVLLLVISEALALCLCAAVIGLGAALALFPLISQSLPDLSWFVGTARMSTSVVVVGLLFATGLALLSAAIPAWHATRLKVVDALAAR
jgi:putative ABC transport system permease protein